MKKLSVLFLSLVALATAITSCSKNDNAAPAVTALELTIKSPVGVAVPNATVKLYSDSASKNLVGTATSDASGKVTFNQNLTAIVYYFDVAAGCLTNQFSADYKTVALTVNTTNKMDVTLANSGTVTVTNASTTDSYNLYLTVGTNPEVKLGKVSPSNGGPLAVPTGVAVVFRAVKLGADGVTESTVPADTVTKTVNVATCGGTDTFTFPQA